MPKVAAAVVVVWRPKVAILLAVVTGLVVVGPLGDLTWN